MVKSTKIVRAISSIITFQKRIPQGIQSVTIKGKEALADLELDKNYDMDLKLNADKDKLNGVSSSVPFIQATTSTSGSVPDEQKSVTLAQDLREFPLTSGELVTVEKTENALTLNDSKVKELVESKAEALKKELGTGTGATAILPQQFNIQKSVDEAYKSDILNVSLNLPIYIDDVFSMCSIFAYGGNGEEYSMTVSVPAGYGSFLTINNNLAIKFNSSREITNIEIYFKKGVNNLTIKGFYFGELNSEIEVTLNSLSETYDSITTSGNTAQPF